jgi:hypothetical protein
VRPATRVVAALLVVATGACDLGGASPTAVTRAPASPPGVSTSPLPSGAAPPPLRDPHPFVVADLPRIVLGPADAPPGTQFAWALSVDQNIEAFSTDEVERQHLIEEGFVVGHGSLFVPRGQLAPDAPPVRIGAVFVQGIAGLFETRAGAEPALRRYERGLWMEQLMHSDRIAAGGLGDLAFGLRGITTDGGKIVVYAWQRANLILVVSGAGEIAKAQVRSLAETVDRRAAEAG